MAFEPKRVFFEEESLNYDLGKKPYIRVYANVDEILSKAQNR